MAREYILRVRLNDVEQKMLEELAAAEALPVAEYLRQVIRKLYNQKR